MLARWVREQRQNQRGLKVYSLHAPEVECIGKGKAHRPYEFGVKVSIATTLHHSKGGQFIATRWRRSSLRSRRRSAPALPASSPIAAIAGHNAPPDYRSRSISRPRSDASPNTSSANCVVAPAVEPVIGHAKGEHRMGRNYLASQQGDAANAVLAAAGYNFRRLLPGSSFGCRHSCSR
jgi:IS5 family transposase